MALKIVEDVEWTERGSGVPTDKVWARSDETPVKGETRIRSMPVSVESQMPLLFMPGLSALNGWDEYPLEIDRSAIVFGRNKCLSPTPPEHLSLPYSRKYGYFEMEVEDVVSLSQVPSLIPQEQPDITDLSIFCSFYFVETQNWLHVDAQTQSDVGGYILCKKQGERFIVILHQEWGFTKSEDIYCTCTNRPMSETELAKYLGVSRANPDDHLLGIYRRNYPATDVHVGVRSFQLSRC
ncbi:MAG: hypothetical protein GY765_33290 [bacterium]|nr:hypothetical protein [bacterium]